MEDCLVAVLDFLTAWATSCIASLLIGEMLALDTIDVENGYVLSGIYGLQLRTSLSTCAFCTRLTMCGVAYTL